MLQALKLFTQLAEHPAAGGSLKEARAELEAQLSRFQEQAFGKYELEIRTQLMLCERVVAKLTSARSFDPYLIRVAGEARYTIKRLDMPAMAAVSRQTPATPIVVA